MTLVNERTRPLRRLGAGRLHVTLLAGGRRYPDEEGRRAPARRAGGPRRTRPADGEVDYGYLLDGDTTRCRTPGPAASRRRP